MTALWQQRPSTLCVFLRCSIKKYRDEMSQSIAIWGATGSIGQQTLDVIRLYPDEFEVVALTARSTSDQLIRSCEEFKPKFAVVQDHAVSELVSKLKEINSDVTALSYQDHCALTEIYGVDTTVTAVSGAAGLGSVVESVCAGNRVLIANKEPVVMLGRLLKDLVQKHGTTVLPVDSELNAIFQCSGGLSGQHYQPFHKIAGLRRILLTGSGGPFLETDLDALRHVTPQQAVAHPVWSMGAKISVDSATMMNKGLEIIEVRWFFDTPPDKIEIVVHPQGIVHSMVEYEDGSVLAQLGSPDMRIPISNTLFWPDRRSSGAEYLNMTQLSGLKFQKPDFIRYPCLEIAHAVAKAGGTSAAVMNASNEEAVAAFLSSKIEFSDIAALVRECVDRLGDQRVESIEQVQDVDLKARAVTKESIHKIYF